MKKNLEKQMSYALSKPDYAERMFAIKELGFALTASLVSWDLTRVEKLRQMSKMAGYNLVEDCSGKNKSGIKILKRKK